MEVIKLSELPVQVAEWSEEDQLRRATLLGNKYIFESDLFPTKEELFKKFIGMNIPLTPHTVAQYTDMLMNPQKYNCDYKPLKECFRIAKKVTPQDELYEQYVSYINKPLPKPVFYIIMRNMYPALFGADVHKNDLGELVRGRLGFKLEFIKLL